MPTLAADVQAVLATDKVRFQGQEVAFVVAEDRYSARDALELITVDYEPLPPVVDARMALDPAPRSSGTTWRAAGQPHLRLDGRGQGGDRCGLRRGRGVVARTCSTRVPILRRWRPAESLPTDKVSGKLTLWSTTQAPHAHRTLYAMVTGLPEHKIRIVSPDLGGGFGNKVPIYPGYLCAIVGSMVTGRPVKWVEDRSENLMSTSFARDYHMHGEIAATRDGRILGLRARVLADHGAFNGAAQPTKFPAGFFHIFTGSYDLQAALCEVTGVYTNKAPGGVAYSCSFRITEAVYLVERLVDMLARELGMDPAELRMQNLLRPEQFPYTGPTGWQYDSGDYPRALRLAMDIAGYDDLRREQAEMRSRGEYMGIGLCFFTEGVGAGPREHMDILGLGMADGADLRVHPTGKAVLGISVQTQGQGHETTFAQIVAQELGLSPDDVEVVHGDTDRTPFGLGTYGSRSTPVSGAAAAVVARKVRERARIVASAMLEVAPTTSSGAAASGGSAAIRSRRSALPRSRWRPTRRCPPGWGRGSPRRLRGLQPAEPDVSVRGLHLRVGCGSGDRRGRGAAIHRGGRLRRAHQPHDRRGPGAPRPRRRDRDGADAGHRVRRGGQLPWRLVHGLPAADRNGVPVVRARHDRHALAAPPHRRKGFGESATVGSPAAVVNSVIDALAPFGVRHADMPLTPANVWCAIHGRQVRTDLAIT